MWYSREIEKQKYAIKFMTVGESNCYKIWLSDLVRVWVENVTSEDLVKRCMELNPHIEAKSEKIISKSLALLESEIADFSLGDREPGDDRTLIVTSRLASVPFRVVFNLQLEKQEAIYEELTLPLLMLVDDLQSKQILLMNELKRKDIEINEYRLEGARLPRGHLTDLFDEKSFLQGSSKLSLSFRETSEPMQIFIKSAEKFTGVMKKQLSSTSGSTSTEMAKEMEDPEDLDSSGSEMPELESPESPDEDATEVRHKYLAMEKAKKMAKRQKLAKRKPALRL